jgi:MFS family permease
VNEALAARPTLLAHRPFVEYVASRGLSEFAYQIGTVAIGWQVYAMTGSAFALGMVGLAQFIPSALLVFAAGHVADRYDRKRVVQACQFVQALASLFLAWGTLAGWLNLAHIFVALTLFGIAIAFESPAAAALLPAVAPKGLVQKGTAVSTAVWQSATICGPALGGVAYAAHPGVPYAAMAVFWCLSGILIGLVTLAPAPAAATETASAQSLYAGVGFIRRNPAILGAISLDLFAVLLGGATALLPIYARDILHAGPWGLGILRGAPAVGALLMSAWLAHHSIARRAGMRMFQAVIVFGLCTLVFALSRSMWLSVTALAVMGAADSISVVIRIALVQLSTPDAMRGRVGAVNYLFVNASNQLGEFESGITAALFGAVPAVVLGAVGTVAVALIWMRLFPALRGVERLE